jgi:fructose-bisphosphate aldolase class II
MIKKFSTMLREAEQGGYAVGAFNTFNYLTTKAVIEAAEELKAPTIIQISASNVKILGAANVKQWLFPLVESSSASIAVHLDHCTSMELIKECIDLDWTAVMYDGSALPLEENMVNTKEVVDYVKASNKDIDVEGETGAIKGVEEDIVSEKTIYTSLEDTMKFIEYTGIDAIAPSIGTAHGVYKHAPNIDYKLLKDIHQHSPVPIVIHGGTGLSVEDFQKLILHGGSKVNVSTAIKNGYLEGYGKHAKEAKKPLELDSMVQEDIKNIVMEKIKIFGGVNKDV